MDIQTDLSTLYSGHRSILVLVIAKSGRGKTTAIRNLDPQHNYLINVMGKSLPFMRAMSYKEKDNLLTSGSATEILSTMRKVGSDERFTSVVIDDAQYIMATEMMDKAMVKGYEKFTLMAKNFWDILKMGSALRPGLKVFVLAHEEDLGGERKLKTFGKMLDEKLIPEGMAAIVLFGDVEVNENKRTYYFLTESDGVCNAKAPLGMFPPRIPNDLDLVRRRIDEYYSCVPLEESALLEELELHIPTPGPAGASRK